MVPLRSWHLPCCKAGCVSRGWRDGLVCKSSGSAMWGPEFESPAPTQKLWESWSTYDPSTADGDGRIPRALQLTSLAHLHFRFSDRPCLKAIRQSRVRKALSVLSWPPHAPAYSYVYNTQTHNTPVHTLIHRYTLTYSYIHSQIHTFIHRHTLIHRYTHS